MLEITTFSIVVMGLATIFLSFFVAYKFWLQSKRLSSGSYTLSNALMWQLIGEALLGVGTTVFAVLAYMNLLPHVSESVQSMIRVCMFSASSLTTIHLYLVTSRMANRNND